MKIKRKKKPKKPHSYILLFLSLYTMSTFLSLYSGNYIAWSVFYLLTCIFFVDTVLLLAVSRNLLLSQEVFPSVLECYQPLSVNLVPTKKSKFALLPQYFFPYKEAADKKFKFYTLDTIKTLHFIPKEVGVHYFGLDYYYLKSFFGLYLLKRKLPKDNIPSQRCFVLPAPRELENPPQLDLDAKITVIKRFNNISDYEDYLGVRPYVAGDPLKSIHFKKSSALGKSMVKQYGHLPQGPSVHIYVGQISSAQYTLTCEAILAIAKCYESLGNQFTFLTFSQGFQKVYPQDTLSLLQNDLAHYNPMNTSVDTPLAIPLEFAHLPTAYVLSSMSDLDSSLFSNQLDNSFCFALDERTAQLLATMGLALPIYTANHLL